MRIKDKYRIIIYSIIIFQVLPWGLNFIAFVIGMFIEGAFALYPYISGTILYIANWPSFLMGIFPTTTSVDGKVVIEAGEGIFDPSVILYNSIGWAIVGLIVGIIISVIKFKK
jgi:hypothetical protein